MKRWQMVLVSMMALVLLALTPMTALAQDDETQAERSAPRFEGALAIVAPWAGFVGKELTMTVFLRENQEPFPGAGVWALTRENADALREELGAMREDGSMPVEERDYEALMEARGIFLGRTGGNGKLSYTFEQSGGYLLVAAKKGYIPGFTAIRIREEINALGIDAPKRAPVGEEVTISVFERLSHDAVEDAGVWAVTRDSVEALKEEVATLREDTSVSAAEKDYEAVVKAHGIFLGRTDQHGKLEHTFNEAGGYLLIAVKKGYLPGFAPLGIIDMPEFLAIKAPPRAQVGKEVNMAVHEREGNEPVSDAGIWALTREEVETLREEMSALRADTSIPTDEKDYEGVVNAHGIFLGRTDDGGKLSYTFNQEGGYLLVAVKRGYVPGFAPIVIKEPPQPKPKPEPKVRPANEKEKAV